MDKAGGWRTPKPFEASALGLLDETSQTLPGAMSSSVPRLPSLSASYSSAMSHGTLRASDSDPANRPVVLHSARRKDKGAGRSRFLSLPTAGKGVSGLHLGQWLRMDGQCVPAGSPWRSSTPSALLSVPRTLIAEDKLSQALELMCDLCFLSEYMHTFGLNQLLDLFEFARTAATIAGSSEAADALIAWHAFAKSVRGFHKPANLSFLIKHAQQMESGAGIQEASRLLLERVRECITFTEERLMKSPSKKYKPLDGTFHGPSSSGSDEVSQISVGTLQAFHALGGSEALSRPWRSRLWACCDAKKNGDQCKGCGVAQTSLAACCEEKRKNQGWERLDESDSIFMRHQREQQSALADTLCNTVRSQVQANIRCSTLIGSTESILSAAKREVIDSVMRLLREDGPCSVRLVGAAGSIW